MALVANPARAARLGASLNKAFGEAFTITPMMAQADPNGRPIPDTSRTAMTGIIGIWDGPAKSMTPATRGAITDDVAHNWTLSFPSANFSDADFAWTPRKGDVLTRQLDGSVYMIDRTVPNGYGRTGLQLTSRKRGT
jgi:hypothetical protein